MGAVAWSGEAGERPAAACALVPRSGAVGLLAMSGRVFDHAQRATAQGGQAANAGPTAA